MFLFKLKFCPNYVTEFCWYAKHIKKKKNILIVLLPKDVETDAVFGVVLNENAEDPSSSSESS